MSVLLAWKSAAKSNEKIVDQKDAALFLSWMPFIKTLWTFCLTLIHFSIQYKKYNLKLQELNYNFNRNYLMPSGQSSGNSFSSMSWLEAPLSLFSFRPCSIYEFLSSVCWSVQRESLAESVHSAADGSPRRRPPHGSQSTKILYPRHFVISRQGVKTYYIFIVFKYKTYYIFIVIKYFFLKYFFWKKSIWQYC